MRMSFEADRSGEVNSYLATLPVGVADGGLEQKRNVALLVRRRALLAGDSTLASRPETPYLPSV